MASRGKTAVDAAPQTALAARSDFAIDTPRQLASSSFERFCGSVGPSTPADFLRIHCLAMPFSKQCRVPVLRTCSWSISDMQVKSSQAVIMRLLAAGGRTAQPSPAACNVGCAE